MTDKIASGQGYGLEQERRIALHWTGQFSLTWRILAVNIFALVLLAGGFFYLDSYRERITDERLEQARNMIWTLAQNPLSNEPLQYRSYLGQLGDKLKLRFRVYAADGRLQSDSFVEFGPSYRLIDPAKEPWRKDAARLLDRLIDKIVGAPSVELYRSEQPADLSYWPEALRAQQDGGPYAMMRYAPDRTPIITAAAGLGDGRVLFVSHNARDITRTVRNERAGLAMVILVTVILTILLSLFLARTIVSPIRHLAESAHRVRDGRDREVVIPRMPARRDEIGMLARALSDMNAALVDKIDATESFAADVSHELKNPIASLRSALEGLHNVKDPDLRGQLLAIAENDVQRLDRLISDIAYASRIDAQLNRIRLEPIDMGEMIDQLLQAREMAGLNRDVKVAFARPARNIALVMGEGIRLERVLSNLLDNAVSFSPKQGLVSVGATRNGDQVEITVSDHGPGVAEEQREAIFRRFHSERPEGESFGEHSGLGLAIARSIIEAHGGEILVDHCPDGGSGACFKIILPGVV